MSVLFSASAFADVGGSEGGVSCGADDVSCVCNVAGASTVLPFVADKTGTCEQAVNVSCSDYLPFVNIEFEIDTEGGAEFERYPNPKNESEVGYRTCGEECKVIVAGKCRADVNPTVTVTVTATPDPTTTVTPTPTPVPVCDYYKGSLDSVNDRKNGGKNLQVSNGTDLTCVDQKVQEFTNACYSLRYSNYYDDCIATKFSDTFFGGMKINNKYNKYRWNVNTAAEKSKLTGNAVVGSGTCTAADFNIPNNYNLYTDNCQVYICNIF